VALPLYIENTSSFDKSVLFVTIKEYTGNNSNCSQKSFFVAFQSIQATTLLALFQLFAWYSNSSNIDIHLSHFQSNFVSNTLFHFSFTKYSTSSLSHNS
jgi:hypothetical protein